MSFFFIYTATTDIYTLSLHDALPIWPTIRRPRRRRRGPGRARAGSRRPDRKSTRLNSSHVKISYAVFCLKKKKTKKHNTQMKAKYYRNLLRPETQQIHIVFQIAQRAH